MGDVMDTYLLMRKWFVVGIIFFFIGISISLALHAPRQEEAPKYNNTLQQTIYSPTMQPLLWEKNAPQRVQWSKHLFREIEKILIFWIKPETKEFFNPKPTGY
jgi:hypothetical protein